MPKSKKRDKSHGSHGSRIKKRVEQVNRLNQFVGSHIKKLEIENERMKTDPESVVGQIIPQLREAIAQNKRLSVLAAAIIESSGGSFKLTKEQLEAFETKVLTIKWELPEGVEKVEDASEFIFTYEAMTQEEAAAKAAEFKVTPVNGEQPTTVEIVSTDEEVPQGELESTEVTEEVTPEVVENTDETVDIEP